MKHFFYIIYKLDKTSGNKTNSCFGNLFLISDCPANVLQGTETTKFEYKSILERCHCFLLEELEPSYFLRNEEFAAIFASIKANVKEQTNRTTKNELLL